MMKMGTNADLGRCFITGGAGFIGSHLVDYLLERGTQITVYDNLSLSNGRSVPSYSHDPKFQFINADVRDTDRLQRELLGHDTVFHLAANTDIPRGNSDTRLDLENCLLATHSLLEAMRSTNVRNLVFASSSTVFGDIEVHPTPENVGPLLPISLYGAGKLACEGFISAFSNLFGFRAIMFRFGNVVGGRMGHGVIHDFIKKLRKDPTELEVLGDGEQEKNYFLVEDCIDGMIHGFIHSPKPCDVYNLGSETTVKVRAIARIVIEEMGHGDVRLRFTGGRRGWPGDVPRVIYDLTKITTLGWKARHSSAEAVRIATRRLLQNAATRSQR